MTRIRSLPKLLTLIARVLVRHVRVRHATIFLKDRDAPRFMAVVSRGPEKPPEPALRLEATSPLVAWLREHRRPVVAEALPARLHAPLLGELTALQAAVCVPSVIHGTLQGFLVLGAKRSGDGYDQDDLDALTTLAAQAALAIENAQAYEELRDTRDQLLYSERMATIGTFASDMAHEIKNPLQSILTYFDLLPSKRGDVEFQERFARLAQAEAERINNLVRQLMTYAAPQTPTFAPLDITHALDSVLALLENDLDRARVEVRKGYSPNGLTVEADRDQMKQVFLNLLANAREAMTANGDRPRLLDLVAYPDGATLVIKIRDTGAGIPEPQVPLIFAPFFTTKEKGSGLGLAIVQNLLRVHGAAIHVESQVGAGTTFTLTFPRRQADRPTQDLRQALARPARSDAAPARPTVGGRSTAPSILVVEPLKDARESTQALFESQGITCWTAPDAPRALELLKDCWPDVVLSEVVLDSVTAARGARDGFRVLAEAKRLAPSRPVFLITAYDLPEFREQARALGADGYLVKPASREQLLSILPTA